LGAGLLLALLVPSIASAANTASFSSRVPSSGSWTTSTRPTLSATVYDRYGIHGTGAYSVTVDGKTVSVSATYLVSGSWNPLHPNYTRIRLKGLPPTALTAGTHKVTVKIHDLKSHNSTSSWSFTVKTPVTFSSASPANGSSDDDVRPAISVKGYAVNGAKGTGKFTMTVDGSAVTPVVTHTTKYTRFKIARPATTPDLGVGVHTVAVSATDINGKAGSYSWSFTILPPPILPMPNSVDLSECAGCHSGYPIAHPMTACAACHSATAPPRADGEPMNTYGSGDKSAHTLSCAVSLCHRGGGILPHVLDADCARCHTGSYPGIPAAHSGPVEQYHLSDSPLCTLSGCHVTSITTEHYRRSTAAGRRLSCETCHASSDPKVVAAIAGHSTSCETCHSPDTVTHPSASSLHTAAAACVSAGCHSTDVTIIHEGKGSCAACHGPGRSPSAVCADCHASGTYHVLAAIKHLAAPGGCVGAGCHTQDVSVIHVTRSVSHCEACHIEDQTPTLVCSTCHSFADHASLHNLPAIRTDGCTGELCHAGTSLTTVQVGAVVSTIHGTCATCHGATLRQAVKDAIAGHDRTCSACHSASSAKHTAAHNLPTSRTDGCTGIPCHDGKNLVGIHPTCATCHESTVRPAVGDAIRSHNKDCVACHTLDAIHHSTYRGFGCNQPNCHTWLHEETGHAIMRPQPYTPNCNAQGCHPTPFGPTVVHDYSNGCADGCH
jgi:hypothetical protein